MGSHLVDETTIRIRRITKGHISQWVMGGHGKDRKNETKVQTFKKRRIGGGHPLCRRKDSITWRNQGWRGKQFTKWKEIGEYLLNGKGICLSTVGKVKGGMCSPSEGVLTGEKGGGAPSGAQRRRNNAFGDCHRLKSQPSAGERGGETQGLVVGNDTQHKGGGGKKRNKILGQAGFYQGSYSFGWGGEIVEGVRKGGGGRKWAGD